MHYFPQRYMTDCLLACVETLIEQPRENIPTDLIEWSETTTGNKYLNYSSVGNILNFFNKFCFLKFAPQYDYTELNDEPAIVGVSTKGFLSLHSMFWDGARFYDPWYEEFIPYNKNIKISYLISTNYNQFHRHPFIGNGHFKLWDSQNAKYHRDISGKIIEQTKIDDTLPELPFIQTISINNRSTYEENH